MFTINKKNPTLEEVIEFAKSHSISENKLDKAIEGSSLPTEGTFKEWAIFGDTALNEDGSKKLDSEGNEILPTTHFRIIANTDESISIGRLQNRVFRGEPTAEDFKYSEKLGGYYLAANFAPNPGLQGNHAAIALRLRGKNFTAEKVTCKTTRYVKGGYKSPEEGLQNIVSTDVYIVNVK